MNILTVTIMNQCLLGQQQENVYLNGCQHIGQNINYSIRTKTKALIHLI